MCPKPLKMQKRAVEVLCGLFSKKEAAHLIAGGARHLHSSTLASRDTGARATTESIETNTVALYPWEQADPKIASRISSSAQRYDFIREVLSRQSIASRRDLKERLETVMEELLTNAIYHAYLEPDGAPRYQRRQSVQLPENDAIEVEFAHGNEGALLTVTDRGGVLTFDHVARSFSRCYSAGMEQIEAKASGAGLGIYMVFELATHLKIFLEPGKSTRIACWIAAPGSFDPDMFSFNFFERR